MKTLTSEMLLAARVSVYGLHANIKKGTGIGSKTFIEHLTEYSVTCKSRYKYHPA